MSTNDLVCEDCRQPSNLGNKCRACYARWARKRWADIPERLAELGDIAKRLNETPQPQRKAIAAVGLGKKADPISGKSAVLLLDVKRAIEGPYGEQLLAKLQAIDSANPEKGAEKTFAGKVD